MISYDKAQEFDKVVNENLDAMNSSSGIGLRGNNESKLYFLANDEKGKMFAVINPSSDLSEARDWHLGSLPADIIKASLMPNALSVIGLELVEGRIEQKKDKQKQLFGRKQ